MKYFLSKIQIKYAIFVFLIFSFIKPYIWEYQFVGKFPAENLEAGSRSSFYRPVLCIPNNELKITTVDSDLIHGIPSFEIISNRDNDLFTPVVTTRLKESSDLRTPQSTLFDNLYNEIIRLQHESEKIEEHNEPILREYQYYYILSFYNHYKLNTSNFNYSTASTETDSKKEDLTKFYSERTANLPAQHNLLSHTNYYYYPIFSYIDYFGDKFSFSNSLVKYSISHTLKKIEGVTPSLNYMGNSKVADLLSDTSDGLFYSKTEHKFISLDDISGYDIALLWGQRLSGGILPEDLISFINESRNYYQACSTPPIRAGFTEGYWAAKGSGPLHHWVHLYESTVPGPTKLAQYGYTIPYISKFIANELNGLNPSNFVQIAWMLFCLLGLVYIILYLNMFRQIYFISCIFLMIKISIFYSLGPYYHTLAPGYHWFRELVLLGVVTIFIYNLDIMQNNTNNRKHQRHVIFYFISAGTLAILYLTDPLYFVISAFSIFSSLAVCYYSSLAHVIRNYKRLVIGCVLVAPLFIVYFIYAHAAKFIYIIDKFQNSDFGLFSEKSYYSFYVNCIILICILITYRLIDRPKHILLCIFSVICAITSIYFYSQPDDAHFKKYIELNIPFFLLMANSLVFQITITLQHLLLPNGKDSNIHDTPKSPNAALGIYLSRYIKSLKHLINAIIYKKHNNPYQGATLIICVIAYFASNQLFLLSGSPQLERNIYDDFGNKYFVSEIHSINNISIDANIDENIISHLSSYPVTLHADYVISNYDKYLSFLFGVRNGFDSPDLVAWLNSSKRYNDTLSHLLHKNSMITIVVDPWIMSIDPRNTLKSNHSWAGGLAKAANLNLKARYRVAEIASNVVNSCRQISNDPHAQDWLIFECSN